MRNRTMIDALAIVFLFSPEPAQAGYLLGCPLPWHLARPRQDTDMPLADRQIRNSWRPPALLVPGARRHVRSVA